MAVANSPLGQERAAAGGEAAADGLERLVDRVGTQERPLIHFFAGETFLVADATQAAIDLLAHRGEQQPIRLVRITRAQVFQTGAEIAILLHERAHFRGDFGASIRDGDGARKLADLSSQFRESQLPMQQKHLGGDGCGDVRIAIAIAADPRAKRQPALRRPDLRKIPGESARHVHLQTRERVEKRGVEIPKAGPRFIRHLRLRDAAAIGQPERSDLAFDLGGIERFGLLLRELTATQDLGEALQLRQQRAALRFGRMRGEDQLDLQAVDERLHLCVGRAGLLQLRDGGGD